MTLEQRVSANETAINQLMTIQEGVFELIREVKQVQVDQQVQMHQFQEQMHQFQEQMHQFQEQMHQFQEQMHQFQEQMHQFQEHMRSMDRFNQQTRRLWVKIAKKADWLDEDDLLEDEV
jgi:chromosome segregation ATPase